MRRRIIALIITLAIIGPGIIAGTWVAYYVAQHKHAAPTGYGYGRTTGIKPALLIPWPPTPHSRLVADLLEQRGYRPWIAWIGRQEGGRHRG